MNRFVYGRGWVYQEENDGKGGDQNGGGGGGEGGDGEGSGSTTDDAGAVDGVPGDGKGAAAADAAVKADKKEPAPKPVTSEDLNAEIDKALGYKKTEDPAAKKKAEEEAAAKATAEAAKKAEKHANGKPKYDDKGVALDDQGKPVPPKQKTVAELELTADEKKSIKGQTAERFNEVLGTLKTVTTERDTLAAQNKELSGAVGALTEVMNETGTSQDQLVSLLEFNRCRQSKDPKEMDEALKYVNSVRTQLLTALGREEGGVDLLADFSDLKTEVEEERMTRAHALELAAARRAKTQRESEEQRVARETKEKSDQKKVTEQAAETALNDIDKWVKSLETSDIDYKAKEPKLLAEVDGVIKNYPPKLWVSTLQMLYKNLGVEKALPGAGGGPKPLRPSGAKPGAPAPTDLQQAIDQGLGYSKAVG